MLREDFRPGYLRRIHGQSHRMAPQLGVVRRGPRHLHCTSKAGLPHIVSGYRKGMRSPRIRPFNLYSDTRTSSSSTLILGLGATSLHFGSSFAPTIDMSLNCKRCRSLLAWCKSYTTFTGQTLGITTSQRKFVLHSRPRTKTWMCSQLRSRWGLPSSTIVLGK